MSAPAIILVRPQMGENIGAVARAMKNFGLGELRIVAPRDGWPNEKATEMASNSQDILENTKLYDDVPSALADVQWVAASTARPRDMQKPVVTPEEMAATLRAHEAANTKGAILFGPERTGLTNEDLALCDAVVTIPTSPDHASLNIAQASVVLSYSWWNAAAPNADEKRNPPANKQELEHFFGALEKGLDTANFWNVAEKKERMWLNIRAMFGRMGASSQEVQTLHGILRAISRSE